MVINHPPTFLDWGLRLLVLEPPLTTLKNSRKHDNFITVTEKERFTQLVYNVQQSILIVSITQLTVA